MVTDINTEYEEYEDIIIFIFSWEIDETNADASFGEVQEKIFPFKKLKVVFDFTALKYLNSKAIGYIVDTYTKLEDQDGKLAIFGMNEAVSTVIEIVWIREIIPFFQTREEALSYLG